MKGFKIFLAHPVVAHFVEQLHEAALVLAIDLIQFDEEGHLFFDDQTVEKEGGGVVFAKDIPFLVLCHGRKLKQVADAQ